MKKLILTCFALAAFAMQPAAQNLPTYLDESKPLEQRVEDALSRMTLREKIAVIHAQSKFSSAGVKRLGFPDFWTDDGPHGVRPDVLWDEWNQAGQSNDSCTAFPALTCLAATWNPGVARLYGRSLGEEALYRHKNMILGPGVNIYRTPLNGRNFEYMGEDPYLSSSMVAPYVQGLQSCGVSACVKHYALNNNEKDRSETNIIVSDRALQEIYLPAFRSAVQNGGAWAVMGAYNLYKNQHNCHNQYLLQDVLKKGWNFDGVVVSDWGGTHNTDQAVRNGLDMEFGTGTDGLSKNTSNAYDNYFLAYPYLQAISAGKYSQDELNDKVRRVLRLFFRTSMRRDRPYGFLCSDAHYEAARKIAEEGIVLLQNKNNVLPLDLNQTKKILVVGENAIKMMTVGGGSSSLKVQHEILPLDAVKKRAEGKAEVEYVRGYVGDTGGMQDGLSTGQNLKETRSAQALIDEAVQKAREADAVIFFGGLNKAGHQDSEGDDRTDFGLPYHQDAVVEALAKVSKKLIFVCISGNAAAMPWKDSVPAIVQGWYLGSEAGTAMAAVLFGDVNPSGKLPFTWGQKLDDYGAHHLGAYPGVKRANENIVDEEYKEGIYVGYRWTDKEKVRPLFAFGHGLSYTTFKLGKLRADKKEISKDDSLTFTVNVQNTGSRAGAEVVQLYISDLKCSLPRPLKELKGFRKVFLQPGENRDVTITIGRDALSFYDDRISAWNAEAGDFEASIGTASDALTSKVKFTLK
jgi:beta-glucosidase